jgi:uncharacterized protein YuzE
MKDRYLEITFRKGIPLAAYLYLPRPAGVKSVRTQEAAPGLLVDLDASGQPIGIEITAPGRVNLEQINEILARYGLDPMHPEELAPLRAA